MPIFTLGSRAHTLVAMLKRAALRVTHDETRLKGYVIDELNERGEEV